MVILTMSLPIILGAIIGYVTNYIAIKMLFRPYTEKKIFGIHIPFTPGVIPKGREKLAIGIANLVSKELITEQAFYAHIREEKFKQSLDKKVKEVLDDFLDGNKSISLSKELVSKIEELVKIVSISFFSSDSIQKPISIILSYLVSHMDKLKISELLDEDNGIGLEKIQEVLITNIKNPDNKVFEKLKDFLIQVFEKSLQKDIELKEILGDDFIVFLETSLNKLYNPVSQIALELLKKKNVRDIISEQIFILIDQNKSKLGMLQSFIISFINTKSNMENLIDMLALSVRNIIGKKQTQENLVKGTVEFFQNLSKRKISELQKEYKINVPSVIDSLVNVISHYVKSDNFEKNLKFYSLSLKRTYKDKTVMQFLSNFFNINEEQFSETLKTIVESYLKKPENIEYISDILKSFTSSLFADSQNGLKINIEKEKREKIDKITSEIVYEFIDLQIPNIVKSMEIYDIVYKKINSLDVSDVEKLVLMIMQNQLGWLNIFGGILGGLIGALQLLLVLIK